MPQQITAEQLHERMAQNEPVIIIDALSRGSFERQHLPEAVNIPNEAPDFEERVRNEVSDKNAPIVVYCADESCQASAAAARRLELMGYRHVQRFEAGLEGWKSAGYLFEENTDTQHTHPFEGYDETADLRGPSRRPARPRARDEARPSRAKVPSERGTDAE